MKQPTVAYRDNTQVQRDDNITGKYRIKLCIQQYNNHFHTSCVRAHG